MDCKCLLAQMNIHDVGCKNYILNCGISSIEGGALDSGGGINGSSSAADYSSLGFILPNSSPFHGPGLLETIPRLDSNTASSVNGESEVLRDVPIKPRGSNRACRGILLDSMLAASSSSPSTILNNADLVASPTMIRGMQLLDGTASSFYDSSSTPSATNMCFNAHTDNLFPTGVTAAPTPALSISNQNVLRAKVVQQVGGKGASGATNKELSGVKGTKRRRIASENVISNSNSDFLISGSGGSSSTNSRSAASATTSSSTIAVTAGGVSKTFGCPIRGCEEKYSRLSNMKAHVILSCRRVSDNILELRKALKRMKLRPASVAGLKRGVDQAFLQSHRDGIEELDALIPDSIKLKKQRICKDTVSGTSTTTAAVFVARSAEVLGHRGGERVQRAHQALAPGFIRDPPPEVHGQNNHGQSVAPPPPAASSFSNAAIHI
mmetsp:Transcript_25417/g.40760  ORF Transcript_25417/g.40760 Transcript_25417/m.40760 type:complete len:437 (+) Transcript_25417:269-1579(+)